YPGPEYPEVTKKSEKLLRDSWLKISKLTDYNNHTEARLEIAKFLTKYSDRQFQYYVNLFSHISGIMNTARGNSPREIILYRDRLTDDMRNYYLKFPGDIDLSWIF